MSTSFKPDPRKELFFDQQHWAVVGSVTNESKPAYRIVNKLKSHANHYVVYGVQPFLKESDVKQQLFHSLEAIDGPIDVVDLVCNPKKGLEIVEAAHKLGVKKIFIQPGAESEEIEAFLNANNMEYVHSCVLAKL